jgi:hypothetical protein
MKFVTPRLAKALAVPALCLASVGSDLQQPSIFADSALAQVVVPRSGTSSSVPNRNQPLRIADTWLDPRNANICRSNRPTQADAETACQNLLACRGGLPRCVSDSTRQALHACRCEFKNPNRGVQGDLPAPQ